MASGIEVSSEIVEVYEKVNNRKYSAVILKISEDGKGIVVEKTFNPSHGNPEQEWKEVVSHLSESECRFLFCDFQSKETPTVTKAKLILISWTPDFAPVRSKMMYASTHINLVNKIGSQKTVQATEMAEVDYKLLKESVFTN